MLFAKLQKEFSFTLHGWQILQMRNCLKSETMAKIKSKIASAFKGCFLPYELQVRIFWDFFRLCLSSPNDD